MEDLLACRNNLHRSPLGDVWSMWSCVRHIICMCTNGSSLNNIHCIVFKHGFAWSLSCLCVYNNFISCQKTMPNHFMQTGVSCNPSFPIDIRVTNPASTVVQWSSGFDSGRLESISWMFELLSYMLITDLQPWIGKTHSIQNCFFYHNIV